MSVEIKINLSSEGEDSSPSVSSPPSDSETHIKASKIVQDQEKQSKSLEYSKKTFKTEEIFEMIDALENKDCQINKTEWIKIAILCKLKNFYRLFIAADKDNNGSLSLSEFKTLPIEEMRILSKYFHDIKYKKYKFPKYLTVITFIQIIIHMFNLFTNFSIFEALKFNLDKIYTIVTYMLVHSKTNILHLPGNVIIQLFYAFTLESFNPGWKIMVIYLMGGIYGVLFHVINLPIDLSDSGLSGASGGVSALIVASLVYYGLNQEIENKILRIQAVLAVVYVLFQIYSVLRVSGGDISFWSHIGGLLAGFFLGFMLLENSLPTSNELTCKVCTIILFVVSNIIIMYFLMSIWNADSST